ncbi:MAG: hypothetical protein A3G18_12630 [Rhodospirillales bacterium RIFCSPLOWO2_12_FULL_58_28]|nr:MAG: hypothetical protein A3H92_10035 [Rhodospirillales bacterium RIFCSPLOWO2_02_FULL_58_16]OHC77114.1 MAG: hypothetical protein A3G18_12630 [Rhodospirillales bacterium RIFCSPLOWO2_12_FULL_58_28]
MDAKRRLSDKIISAHEQACREDKMNVADLLLQALELDLSAIGGNKNDLRQSTATLEAAFETHGKSKER